MAVPECCEDTTVIGVGFEPEIFLQCRERNYAPRRSTSFVAARYHVPGMQLCIRQRVRRVLKTSHG